MKPIEASEVLDLAAYQAVRDGFRSDVIALKKIRRVALGPRVTLLFENRNTLLFQIQEMLRVERIGDPDSVQREIDVYNELVPGAAELSATLFIEIIELADVRPELDRLIGLDEHVFLRIGSHELRARFDAKQMEQDRIAAVQYVRFPLGPEGCEALADLETAAVLGVDHPAYRAEVMLAPETRASLLDDLSGSEALLLEAPAPVSAALERELFVLGCAHALQPARPRTPGHLVVEPIGGPVRFRDASPAQHADCAAALQRLVAERGTHRVESRAGGDAPLRFDLYPER